MKGDDMKMTVSRIERKNVSGFSKTGNPYHIDNTMVTVVVPVDSTDGFGTKEMSYQYGDSTTFEKLLPLRGRLPLVCDIELQATLNSYGDATTTISSLRPASSAPVDKA